MGRGSRTGADIDSQELSVVLSDLVGHRVQVADIVGALGLSRSAYYLQRDEGRLICADNLLRIADAFGINPLGLLVRYGLVDRNTVIDYVRGADATDRTPPRRGVGQLKLRSNAQS